MDNLKQIRIEKGLTQMQLAASVGVSLNTIIKWENGAGKPSDENQKRLDEVLNILPFAEVE